MGIPDTAAGAQPVLRQQVKMAFGPGLGRSMCHRRLGNEANRAAAEWTNNLTQRTFIGGVDRLLTVRTMASTITGGIAA
jgi:hypothetical protein